MKKLYLNILVVCCIFCTNACGGNKSKNDKTQEDLVMKYSKEQRDSLSNQLTRYDFEPHYEIYIDTRNSYDALVNDYLVSSDYGYIKQKHSFQINKAILCGGIQQLQIKLLPESTNGKLDTYLKDEDYLTITVDYFTWSKDGSGIDNTVEVLEYKLPKQDESGNDIDYSQKKEVVIDLEFEAKVPYELEGWSNGIEFDIKDKEELKRQIANIYREDIDDFRNKRYECMKSRSLIHDYELAQSIYRDKKDFQKGYTDLENGKIDKDEYFMPLENYEIYFYGNNRLITLRRTDDLYLGESPYIRNYTNEREVEREQFIKMFFSQPKGSDKLVLIR